MLNRSHNLTNAQKRTWVTLIAALKQPHNLASVSRDILKEWGKTDPGNLPAFYSLDYFSLWENTVTTPS